MSSLDPAYVDWLKETTTRLWPMIGDGHFGLHTYHTNFNLGKKDTGKADEKEKQIGLLCDKYGPLYSNIAFATVDEGAWVTSYRQKYRYDGDDEELLGLMAKSYKEIQTKLVNSNPKKTTDSRSTPVTDKKAHDQKAVEANTKTRNESLGAMHKSQQIDKPKERFASCYDEENNDDIDEEEEYEYDRYEQEHDLDNTLRGSYGRHGYGEWD